MIIIKLTGGLGNQMFQYAAGKSLASKLNTQIYFDVDYYKKFDLRVFELGCFGLEDKVVEKKEIWFSVLYDKPPFSKLNDDLRRRLFKLLTGKTYFKEKSPVYDPSFFNHKEGGIYIDGHWNSEKYFKNISGQIRKDFKFMNDPPPKVKKYLSKIKKSIAVSLHVRRTDYVSVKKNKKIHGLCSLDYYNKAMSIISKKVSKPIFFVFSDDKKWVKENIKSKFEIVYVDHGGKDYEDMRLMGACKHHIVANSTFSWWGAWLNPNKEKTVIAPKKWFQADNMNDKDICPNSWMRI